MKRMAPPARAKPNALSRMPVSAAETAMMIATGASKSSGRPWAASRAISALTKVAVTATVVGSGPAMAKGRELRSATMAAVTALVMKVAARP